MLLRAPHYSLQWSRFVLFLAGPFYYMFSITVLCRNWASVTSPSSPFIIALVLSFISHILLWQYCFRPDWSPWGILLMLIVTLSLSVSGYLSSKWQNPELEGVARTMLISNCIIVTLHAGSIACLFLHLPRAYEPLVKSSAAVSCWNWRSLPVSTQEDTACDQTLSHSEDLRQLGSLYKAHECLRKGATSKLSKTFAPVSHLYF